MRRSISILVVGLFAGSLVGGAVGVVMGSSGAPAVASPPAAAVDQPQAVLTGQVLPALTGGPTPAGVMADLTYIDKLLTKLIADEQKGTGLDSRDLVARVNAIKKAKQAMVKEFFDGPTYGSVTWSEVFSKLDCLDSELFLGTGEGINGGGPLGNSTVAKNFGLGQKCKQTLETELAKSVEPPKPALTPIKAVFTPSLVPGCKAPACATVYTETATGTGLSYNWTVTIDADPGCANGFHPNVPTQSQATWYHADTTEGGPCNHAFYDGAGRGHPGIVKVTVSNIYWTCDATYQGTQGDNGSLTGVGDPPQPCTKK